MKWKAHSVEVRNWTHACINNLVLYKTHTRTNTDIWIETFSSEHTSAAVCTVTHASKQRPHSVYFMLHTLWLCLNHVVTSRKVRPVRCKHMEEWYSWRQSAGATDVCTGIHGLSSTSVMQTAISVLRPLSNMPVTIITMVGTNTTRLKA
jgi:hypothetical protein